MAPEVALGKAYDKSVDVYSFGIIIWQVLKGKMPFKDMGRKAYMEKVVLGGIRPQCEEQWPTEFSTLLRQCWHEDRACRPDFDHIIEVLDRLIEQARQPTFLGHIASSFCSIFCCIPVDADHGAVWIRWKSRLRKTFYKSRGFIGTIATLALIAGTLIARYTAQVILGTWIDIFSTYFLYIVLMMFVRGKKNPSLIRMVGLEMGRTREGEAEYSAMIQEVNGRGGERGRGGGGNKFEEAKSTADIEMGNMQGKVALRPQINNGRAVDGIIVSTFTQPKMP